MYGIIFFVVWLILALFILFSIFTKRGHRLNIEMQFKCKVVNDLGELNQDDMLFGKQKLRLYECSKENEIFYVLESRQTQGLGFAISYIKLDHSVLGHLAKLNRVHRPTKGS